MLWLKKLLLRLVELRRTYTGVKFFSEVRLIALWLGLWKFLVRFVLEFQRIYTGVKSYSEGTFTGVKSNTGVNSTCLNNRLFVSSMRGTFTGVKFNTGVNTTCLNNRLIASFDASNFFQEWKDLSSFRTKKRRPPRVKRNVFKLSWIAGPLSIIIYPIMI